jgi:hypothetical protein
MVHDNRPLEGLEFPSPCESLRSAIVVGKTWDVLRSSAVAVARTEESMRAGWTSVLVDLQGWCLQFEGMVQHGQF